MTKKTEILITSAKNATFIKMFTSIFQNMRNKKSMDGNRAHISLQRGIMDAPTHKGSRFFPKNLKIQGTGPHQKKTGGQLTMWTAIGELLTHMSSSVLITSIVCFSFIVFVLLLLTAIIKDYPERLQQIANIVKPPKQNTTAFKHPEAP